MSLFRFSLICPRCDKQSETTAATRTTPPRVHCGDCLMDSCEIVELKVVSVEMMRDPKIWANHFQIIK